MKYLWKKNIGVGDIILGQKLNENYAFKVTKENNDGSIWCEGDSGNVSVMLNNNVVVVICCFNEFIISGENIIGMAIETFIQTIGGNNFEKSTKFMPIGENYDFKSLGIDIDVVDGFITIASVIWDNVPDY